MVSRRSLGGPQVPGRSPEGPWRLVTRKKLHLETNRSYQQVVKKLYLETNRSYPILLSRLSPLGGPVGGENVGDIGRVGHEED